VWEHGAWWAEHHGQPLARGAVGAGDAPAGLDAYTQALAASERDEQARSAWRAAVAQLDPAPCVVVDDRGTHTSVTRLCSWAPQGQRATSGSVPRTHGQTVTLVAARAPDGVRLPWLIAGAMETATFAWDIREQWAPTLRPGQVVVVAQ
jgi:hypothetical protein